MSGPATTAPAWTWTFRGLVFLYGPIIALAPKGAVILLLLSALIVAGRWLTTTPRQSGGQALRATLRRLVPWLVLFIAAWMLIRLALPSPEPQNPLLWFKVLVLSLAGLTVLSGYASAAGADRHALATAWLYGLAAGLLLMALAEVHAQITDTALWGPKVRTLIAMEPGRAVLVFALWPALALIRQRLGVATATLLAAVALGCLLLVHDGVGATAWLVGIAVLAVAGMGGVAGRALAIGAIAGVALAIPAGALLLNLTPGAAATDLLPFSALHRLSIWDFAATRIAASPWIGIGGDGVRYLAETFRPAYAPVAGDAIALLPLHPHNGFLQAWLEFGLPGLVLALALVVTVARAAAERGPAALAGTAGAVMVASVAFGLWQSWWLSSLWLTVAIAAALLPHRH
ncbi:MAG: O-antigen ligase family protein [Alphaproteobacteria bacterium]